MYWPLYLNQARCMAMMPVHYMYSAKVEQREALLAARPNKINLKRVK
jgi:hypothetical protein